MAVRTQDEVKTLFQTGDEPTEQDFIDLIDTLESNSAVNSVAVAGTNDVWTDVNSTTSIVQTSKQINIVVHNGSYYLFNGGIDTYGLGGIATTASSFKKISSETAESDISVQHIEVLHTDQESYVNLDNLIIAINTGTTFTHSTNQTTIIKYRSVHQNLKELWYLFNAPAGTYGVGETAVGTSNFKEIATERAITSQKVSEFSVTGTGNVWDDVNANTQVFAANGWLAYVTHNNKVYMLNPELDTWGNPQIYGQGFVLATESNFILITENKTKDSIHNTDITEVAWTNGAAIDLDLTLAENFTITVTGGGTAPTVGNNTITMSNASLRNGQSGYIRISRSSFQLAADTYLSFIGPAIELDVVTTVADNQDIVMYLYEVVGDSVLIYAQHGLITV